MPTNTLPTPQEMERELADVCAGEVRATEPMMKHTTWRVGGPADVWVEPADREDALDVIRVVRRLGWPLLVLGSGSNVLVADAGIRGVVLNLGPGLSRVTIRETDADVQAGISLFKLAKQLARAGLAGAEFCIGIPGTLGGALAGNAGAFGSEIGDITGAVELYDFADDHVITLERSVLEFSYRRSSLAGRGVILSATLELTQDDPDAVRERVRAHTTERTQKQPVEIGSGGSVFKNPAGDHAGRLIDELGLKEHAVGGVKVSPKHANFFVNDGSATAADVRALIEDVKGRVAAARGVQLEEEIRYVGAWT